MKTWLSTIVEWARNSLWLTPAGMSIAAIALAYFFTEIDQRYGTELIEFAPWLRTTGQAARSSLAAIAGALITVSGVVVSITVVSLSVTATQFGSRLLRTVLRDRVTHVAMGGLLASSLYSLLVLSAVREDESIYVPHLSVAVAIVLAVLNLGVLIYFTHNIGVSIQAPVIIRSVAADLESAIDRLFPEEIGDQASKKQARELKEEFGKPAFSTSSQEQGYVQAIDGPTLLDLAVEQKLVIKLYLRPGDFMFLDRQLADVWVEEGGQVDREEVARKIQQAVIIGVGRTSVQDVEYAFNELVEIALRALSPGINDSFTAMTCIDWIADGLRRVAQRPQPSPYRQSPSDGSLRVVVESFTFERLAASAIDPIRRSATTNVMVSAQLLQALQAIAENVQNASQAEAVLNRCTIIAESFQQADIPALDRQIIRDRYHQTVAVLRSAIPDLETPAIATQLEI